MPAACCCCCCLVASVVSNSVWPQRRQPTMLPRPWDSPGKITGVGCHFFLQCMKVKNENEVAQSCPTLSDHMDCSLPGCSIHGIFPGKSTGVGCHCLLHPPIWKVVKTSKVAYLTAPPQNEHLGKGGLFPFTASKGMSRKSRWAAPAT